ncbi:tetratricopeptide repeat-containing sulfotransferase family protein [Kordiimonas aestuarii]|uniref:tetratricopeptide repeat-containing sulfotransferase family protein n=1 Tax=Kordiimonas aestuarii TaxID=1005925 RepID=UPI0021D2B4E3|nr:tetratricopeptide repeat-containing sulfotransferase family protein [Kordiimonas aestuarii]
MDALQLIRQGLQLLADKQPEKAEGISKALLAQFPDLPPVCYFACEVALYRGSFTEALKYISRAIELDSGAPALHLKKAQVELMLRQGMQAQESAKAAAALKPEDAGVQFQAGQIFMRADNPTGAEGYLTKAKSMGLDSPHFLFELAKNRYYCGDMTGAEDAVSRFLAKAPGHGEALMLRAKLKKQTPADNHTTVLQAVLGQKTVWKDEVGASYALAKEQEDLGNYEEAFAALKRGADVQRAHLRYDVGSEVQNMTDITTTFTKQAYDSMAAGATVDAPIFIVGMPRTGTTLVERILGNHADVTSGGELNDFSLAMRAVINTHIVQNPDKGLNPLSAALEADYTRMGELYLQNVHGMIGKAGRFTDKLPFNFLYCGLIKKALPNAKIIHLVRNPMDTCFAVYKTLFNQAYFFSYDMSELAEYYIAYHKLMTHWSALLPDDILDVSYEKLVTSPKSEGKRIAEHCGFAWSNDLAAVEKSATASSTASAAQIREPIYTSSVENWRNYENHLGPLHDKLEAAGLIGD